MDTLKYMTLNPQGLVSNMADGFVAVTEQGNSGGVHLRTAKIGASITIDFNGSGFEFYGKKGSGAGDLEISVDGGEAEKPIIIDVYGEGDKPLIDGNGLYSAVPSYGANGPFGESCSAVYLYNQEYWEINNLAVKNHTSAGDHTYELIGIRVEASGGGVYNHIYIKNREISDVNGRSLQDDIWTVRPQGGGTDFYGARTTHRTGGINIISYTNRENNASDKTNPGTILDEEPTIFNDILIGGNVITNRKLWTVHKHLQQSKLTSFQQLSIQQ